MRRRIRKLMVMATLLMGIGLMVGTWPAIHKAHNRYGEIPAGKPASSELCRDYNDRSTLGKWLDITAWDWCD